MEMVVVVTGEEVVHIDLVSNFAADESIHVVGVCESWLLESDSSLFVDLHGFTLISTDISGHVRQHGGAVYIDKSLKFKVVEVNAPNVVVVHLLGLALLILVVYRPSSYVELKKQCIVPTFN